jgi:hypothetical protein
MEHCPIRTVKARHDAGPTTRLLAVREDVSPQGLSAAG